MKLMTKNYIVDDIVGFIRISYQNGTITKVVPKSEKNSTREK